MVSFVSIDYLKPGMVLARDFYGTDPLTSKVIMIKSGKKLTEEDISKLLRTELPGVYVQGDNRFDAESQMVATTEKVDMISSIRDIYDLSENATEALYAGSISHANDVLQRLIDAIVNNKNMYIDLSSLRMYDDCTYNHSLGVTVLSIAMGKYLGMSRKLLAQLAMCALLHDIGKMQIPIEIISKPGKLTKEEFDKVKEHPARGGEILKKHTSVSDLVFNGVVSHHEKFDGTGYPNGIKGKDIPLFGRIVACADVYDALTSTRPYRTPATPAEAIEYVMGNTGRHFDRGVVRAFLKCISPYPIGSCVSLSNGDTAVIVDQNSQNPMRPTVFMMNDPTNIVDLFNDENYFDVVIESLCQ